jgi:ankyrin repeat protein
VAPSLKLALSLALSLPAEKGHEVVVKLLFEKGTELDSKDTGGPTPLSWAAVNGHEVSSQRRKSFKGTK